MSFPDITVFSTIRLWETVIKDKNKVWESSFLRSHCCARWWVNKPCRWFSQKFNRKLLFLMPRDYIETEMRTKSSLLCLCVNGNADHTGGKFCFHWDKVRNRNDRWSDNDDGLVLGACWATSETTQKKHYLFLICELFHSLLIVRYKHISNIPAPDMIRNRTRQNLFFVLKCDFQQVIKAA